MVQETLAGFNCTVFAYGQTGTGKTHTMEGDINSEENAGIVPRSVKAILEQLEQSGSEFTIRVSFLELYNEELQDLLVPPNSDKKLKLCEVEKKGVVCQNLEEITVLSVKDIFEILQRGILQRQTAATLCNKNSSRSHSIFTMKIMIKECNVDGEEVVRHGQLNLVDLAGSECVGRSGAKNDRAREAGSINQSLLTLGRVITALVDHHGHIPYRDSKLTRLLQESLGGKAKTCIIATVTPSQNAVEETLSTLDYAHRAKNIKNMPQVNQRMTKKTVMKEYCEEIESLRAQLQANREKNGVYVLPDVYYGMEAKIASQEAQIAEVESILRGKTDEVKAIKAEKEELEDRVGQVEKELEKTSAELKSTTHLLEQTQADLEAKAVQLTASDAVISEQESTESTLLSYGTELQNEVKLQRSDRTKLFAKLEKLALSNAHQAARTDKYVQDVVASTTTLCKDVTQMLSSNDAEATKMCCGVDEMLSRGRETCTSLNHAISQAVDQLIQRAESNTAVSASLDEIKLHLASTNTEVAKSLQTMQHQLSAWLGDVNNSMLATRNVLNNQREKLNATQRAIEQSALRMNELSNVFKSHHAQASEQFETGTKALQVLIVATFDEQEKLLDASAAHVKQDISSKVQAMQSTMTAMLNELLTSSVQNTDSWNKNVKMAGQIAKGSLGDKVTEVVAVNAAAFDLTQHYIADMNALSASTVNKAIADFASIDVDHQEVVSHVVGVSEAVNEKQIALDSTIASVVDYTNKSVAHVTQTVGNTSETVTALISDIKRDSHAMQTTTATSINNFTTYMNSQGENVRLAVGEHCQGLGEFLQTTLISIGDVEGQTTSFVNEIQDFTVPVSGGTPTKVILFSNQRVLENLTQTRDHAIIRSESQAGIWTLPQKESVQVDNADTEIIIAAVQSEDISGDVEIKTESGYKRSESPIMTENAENIPPNKAQRTSSQVPVKSGIVRSGRLPSRRASDTTPNIL